MWQHLELSVQIRPWDTLACCGDVKRPTNQQINKPYHKATEAVDVLTRMPPRRAEKWMLM